MDLKTYLQNIEQNWHQREGNCASCPKWHTGGFKRPFFGASLQDTLEADVVFVGSEPGTGEDQTHEDWREGEQISLGEATDRISESDWDHRGYPVTSTAMFNSDLLEIVTGEEPLSDSANAAAFDYYITNLEKCHEPYEEPDGEKYESTEYDGDGIYESEYEADEAAIDCCFSYFSEELELLEPQVVVTLGTTARDHLLDRFPGFDAKPRLTKDPFTILESDSVDWKLAPAMHPSDRNLNGSYSFTDIELSNRKTPPDSSEARRVYFDILRTHLVQELSS